MGSRGRAFNVAARSRRWVGGVFGLALAVASCGEAKVPHADPSGWGATRTPSRNELYPGRYPRVDAATLRAREAKLQRDLPGWQISLASSGYLAGARKIPVESSMKLEASEIAEAQRFIDTHLDLFGLTRPERLRRWHDGLYFISPVDDPRYGIALSHAREILALTGHLWPGFTMQSTARKSRRTLLGPWLGRRFTTPQEQAMPCDPVGDAKLDCPSPSEASVTTIGEDNARYVVYARPDGDEIEVREVLVLPSAEREVLIEPDKGPIPRALDARTGELLQLTSYGPGMCEEEGLCVLWGWFNDPDHLEFDFNVSPPQL